jgi:predicted Zn-dependent protease with MMP-like domain
MTASPALDWARLKAPDLDAFEALAHAAYGTLPPEFLHFTGEVMISIADFPEDEVLDEMEAESEFDLLGLFHGTGLPHRGALPETGRLPNRIFLYRRPILDFWAEHDETLGAIVTHVLIHEIGHHFGLSDADMEAIERLARDRD